MMTVFQSILQRIALEADSTLPKPMSVQLALGAR